MSFRRIRVRDIAVIVTITTLVATGCGSESTKDTPPAADEVVKVRDVDSPTPDPKLTKAVGDQAQVLTDAGCVLGTFEIGDPDHVKVGDDLKSTSFPPTSGRHYADWAPFGLYDEPVADGHVIHNLEHGGVAVWIGVDVDDVITEAVADLLDDGEKWLVAPRRDIAGLFSAAWGAGLACSPAALDQLGPKAVATALDAWYDAVESTGSPAEKDVPSYAGAMKEPTPVRDISTEAPF